MNDPKDYGICAAKVIGELQGRVMLLESHNRDLRGQVLALQRERLALKKKLRTLRNNQD